MVKLGNSWDDVLAGEFEKEYYLKLREFLKTEYSSYRVYPPMEHIFRALKETPYDKVKAVILGQDPYHEPGQAQGLCFSVPEGIKIKAAGGIASLEDAVRFIQLGADRLGTSRLVAIAKQM